MMKTEYDTLGRLADELIRRAKMGRMLRALARGISEFSTQRRRQPWICGSEAQGT